MKGSDCIKNVRKKLFLLGLFFFIVMSTSGIYALTNQETDGTLSTGIVDISINNYTLNENNEEIPYSETTSVVYPGDKISLIPKINNLGESCFVRVKINYIDTSTNFLDYTTGFSNSLTKYGDYYYYTDVLNNASNIKIFDAIKIPDDITTTDNERKIKLEIIAEAIQSKNFVPDYSLSDPWKGITPSENTKSSYDIDTETGKLKINILYEDNTINDISVNKDFFKQMYNVMPGDNFVDYAELKNTSKNSNKYYLKILTDNKKENDVIAYTATSGDRVTHRVIKITDEGFETKGDANVPSDGISTTKSNYIGKNIFSIPKLGYLVTLIQTPKGKIILITIIVVILLAGFLLDDGKEKKKKNSDKF